MAKARSDMERYNFIKVDIEQIKSKEWNPKSPEDYQKELERIKGSIARNGIVSPLNVREIAKDTYEILDGEQRFSIYKDLGVKQLTVNNNGKMSDEEAYAFTLSIDQNVPYDYYKESILYKKLVENVGMEKAQEMTAIGLEDLQVRLDALEVPTYIDMEIVTEDSREQELEKKEVYFIRMEEKLLAQFIEKHKIKNKKIYFHDYFTV